MSREARVYPMEISIQISGSNASLCYLPLISLWDGVEALVEGELTPSEWLEVVSPRGRREVSVILRCGEIDGEAGWVGFTFDEVGFIKVCLGSAGDSGVKLQFEHLGGVDEGAVVAVFARVMTAHRAREVLEWAVRAGSPHERRLLWPAGEGVGPGRGERYPRGRPGWVEEIDPGSGEEGGE